MVHQRAGRCDEAEGSHGPIRRVDGCGAEARDEAGARPRHQSPPDHQNADRADRRRDGEAEQKAPDHKTRVHPTSLPRC
jgi:hypothetical protein